MGDFRIASPRLIRSIIPTRQMPTQAKTPKATGVTSGPSNPFTNAELKKLRATKPMLWPSKSSKPGGFAAFNTTPQIRAGQWHRSILW